MSEDLGPYDLPPAEETLSQKASRAIALSGDSPAAATAGQRLAGLANEATKFQVGGYSLANLPSKAMEGATALASSFGIKMPDAFKKIGGGAPAVTATTPITNSEVPASVIKETATVNINDREYLVSLRDSDGSIVEFKVLPLIVENRQVDYEPVAPPQFPGAFQKYKGTGSVTWALTCTFIARTTAEATMNLRDLAVLRSWTMPYFGLNTAANDNFKHKLGAPPPVLKLRGLRGLVGEVPVVINALNWNWPKDVDYIPAYDPDQILGKGNRYETDPQKLGLPTDGIPKTPFPAVMEVSINLVESYSTTEFNNFDLAKYRLGQIKNAFDPTPISTGTASVEETPKQEAQTVPIDNKHSQPPTYLTDSGSTFNQLSSNVPDAFANSPLSGSTFAQGAQALESKASELVMSAGVAATKAADTVSTYVRNPMSGADKAKGH